ncbi:hypothetical protein N7466_004479 [Penicillium verhagenii]|uniref:uncharacterized protein n=1 Tax=Penicillium verhagenii TaxID=1562060 RepID=UPI0025458D42|nr:uncharacterized protein N7466_004479 [Penicillium verhagenii]KAJ5934932.1 hypothetical protein N7466_004479 [Penicillium verhagenii]
MPPSSPHCQKQHATPPMNASPRLGSTIPIVESASLAPPLGPFPDSQPYTTFRSIDNVTQQPLQTAMALQTDGHVHPHSHEMVLQSADQSFQGSYGGLEGEETESANFAGQLTGMKLIPDPPDLEYWRDRLFQADDVITLTEEQFQIYFPHVDNVYSHRSTQRYKRRSMVSHYWDCRLKGRPPGTPKSDDPNKKKRKRTARERDLCDVKIKITEYLPGSGSNDTTGGFESFPAELLPGVHTLFPVQTTQPFGVLTPNAALPEGHPGANGQRYFTIQRVNGNGANGKNDGVSGGHRHTLEESDRVKKNSVQRHFLKEDKNRKKSGHQGMSDEKKAYHTIATGLAAVTAANHAAETNLQFYGSCFCPFVQRVWIALELKGIPYQYIEVDPYEKPQSLLEVNPRGLVPALRHDNWGCYESTVLMEYLEDLKIGPSLLPTDPKLRAHCRLWADHVNRNIVPTFYRVLQEQDPQKQIENAQELRTAFDTLIEAAHPRGPFFMGGQISFVDIQAAPWVVRLNRVLKPYRGWPDAEDGGRWASWVNAIESNDQVRATTSTDELYLESYARYAENRPNTSLLANAINLGRSLP